MATTHIRVPTASLEAAAADAQKRLPALFAYKRRMSPAALADSRTIGDLEAVESRIRDAEAIIARARANAATADNTHS